MQVKITERDSLYDELDRMSTTELLTNINAEDAKVAGVVAHVIPQIALLVDAVIERVMRGGRVFYVGAGTSGRLGVLDASEILPTYGVSGIFIGLIAGGDSALRHSIENAEDSECQCWEDLKDFSLCERDVVIGIAASGTTPYVIGGVSRARREGLLTACITCNQGSPLAKEVEIPIEAVVGPEFVTGSTRMKSGSAQKMILNMISTSVMIKLGRVKGNKMIDMKLSNDKLINRGVRILASELGISESLAKKMLADHGSVRTALEAQK